VGGFKINLEAMHQDIIVLLALANTAHKVEVTNEVRGTIKRDIVNRTRDNNSKNSISNLREKVAIILKVAFQI
jgi:hypothetical protein